MKKIRISKKILIVLMLGLGIVIGNAESPARVPELIFRTGDNKGEIRYAWLASGISDVFSNCSLLVMQGIHSADEVKTNGSPIVSGIAAHSGIIKGEAGEWYSAVVSAETDSGTIYSEVRQVKTKRINEGEYDLRFGVISDVHITANLSHNPYPTVRRFEKALDWYNSEDIETLVINGDITERGRQSDWNAFNSSWEAHRGNLNLIAVMGNHEVMEGDKIITTDRFERYTGRMINAHYVINSYHFIVISGGEGDFIDQGAVGGAIATGRTEIPGHLDNGNNVSPSVRAWLRTRIDIAKEDAPGKPIFIFLHWPVSNTFHRSTGGTTSFGNNPLTGFFKDDPEVVIFGGHIHAPNNDPRYIWQGSFTSINVPTLFYFTLENGYLGGDASGTANNNHPKIAGIISRNGAGQGMIVSVKSSIVTIENFDFDFSYEPQPLDSVVQIPQIWKFDISRPEDFPYTNAIRNEQKTAPIFDESKPANESLDGIIIKSITDTSVEIEFPQAMIPLPNLNNEVVHSYRFDFINRQTGVIDRSAKQYSDFMLHPRLRRPTYTQLIGGLTPGTDYELRIYAYGSFQECSGQYLICTFETLASSVE